MPGREGEIQEMLLIQWHLQWLDLHPSIVVGEHNDVKTRVCENDFHTYLSNIR